MQNKKIRLFKPSIGNEELSNIKKIFKTAWLGYGDRVNEFENKFSIIIISLIESNSDQLVINANSVNDLQFSFSNQLKLKL